MFLNYQSPVKELGQCILANAESPLWQFLFTSMDNWTEDAQGKQAKAMKKNKVRQDLEDKAAPQTPKKGHAKSAVNEEERPLATPLWRAPFTSAAQPKLGNLRRETRTC